MPPERVGPFHVLSVIGRGGVGTVYRARHAETGAAAAVKLLGPGPALDAVAARRFAREYEVLRALDHPNVVRVYEAGVTDGYAYLAMELVEGLDLRAYLSPALDDPRLCGCGAEAAGGPFTPACCEPRPAALRALAAMMDEPETEEARFQGPPLLVGLTGLQPEAQSEPRPRAREPLDGPACEALNRPARLARLRAVLTQVADALAYVHARGLVHRDLKPTNVMVDDHRRARLMDFGLVRTAGDGDDTLAQAGRVVGTYRYMSPEQAQGAPVDSRSDLYSLGVILYELLAGAPPFVARDPLALWREILYARAAPLCAVNPGVDPGLAELAERLLEKEPSRRPQDARAVARALG